FSTTKHDGNDGEDFNLNQKIVSGLSEIIKRGSVDASKEFNDLNKLSLNFVDLSFSSSILILFRKDRSESYMQSQRVFASILNCGKIHPYLMDCFEQENLVQLYKDICKKLYPKQISTLYHSSLVDFSKLQHVQGLLPSFFNL